MSTSLTNDEVKAFFSQTILPCVEDSKKIVDISVHRPGGGVNFTACMCVLTSLSFVAKLADPNAASETAAATAFVRKYFPPGYQPVADLIWKLFRHGHVHRFYPKGVLDASGVPILGSAVGLPFRNYPADEGVSYAEMVERLDREGRDAVCKRMEHLIVVRGAPLPVFSLNATILLIDFEAAASKYMSAVLQGGCARTTFEAGVAAFHDDLKVPIGKLDAEGRHYLRSLCLTKLNDR